MKLLLHTCCGPCFLGVWEELGEHKNIETTLFYDNPNIYPEEEWQKRLDNLKIAAKDKYLDLVVADYLPDRYAETIKVTTADFPVRCLGCYRLRLESAAKYAKENGFDAISTTLFVSPYQQHEQLRDIAQQICDDYKIDFYYTDWRPYFREGQNTARAMEIYRQKYCGCSYSFIESGRSS